MRTLAAVTTCHSEGYELYGREMVETFDRHWPDDVKLYLYAEDFEPELPSARIVGRDLLASCPELVAFKRRHAKSARVRKEMKRPHWQLRTDWSRLKFKLRRKTTLGFRWDAVRFSHKMFAIFDAARRAPEDVLFWLDADTRFRADIPHAFLEGLVPADRLFGYLARPRFSECGFVGYNLRHPAIADFLAEFEALYTTDALFEEREWHDSYLFDVVRKRFERQGHRGHDIAEGAGSEAGHVFANSPLARYMDHLKGERKEVGASPESDLKVTGATAKRARPVS